MAIAKKPKKPATPSKEQKASKFIRAGAGPADNGASSVNGRTFRPILTNFETVLLGRIDSFAVQMGLSRSAFIVNAVAEKVLKLERGE